MRRGRERGRRRWPPGMRGLTWGIVIGRRLAALVCGGVPGGGGGGAGGQRPGGWFGGVGAGQRSGWRTGGWGTARGINKCSGVVLLGGPNIVGGQGAAHVCRVRVRPHAPTATLCSAPAGGAQHPWCPAGPMYTKHTLMHLLLLSPPPPPSRARWAGAGSRWSKSKIPPPQTHTNTQSHKHTQAHKVTNTQNIHKHVHRTHSLRA